MTAIAEAPPRYDQPLPFAEGQLPSPSERRHAMRISLHLPSVPPLRLPRQKSVVHQQRQSRPKAIQTRSTKLRLAICRAETKEAQNLQSGHDCSRQNTVQVPAQHRLLATPKQ